VHQYGPVDYGSFGREKRSMIATEDFNMPKTTSAMAPVPVKTVWSTIDVTKFGPLKEARMARLARMIWSDAEFKKEFLAHPREVLAREASLILPAQTRVLVVEEGSGGQRTLRCRHHLRNPRFSTGSSKSRTGG
jgi:hypothetical protein